MRAARRMAVPASTASQAAFDSSACEHRRTGAADASQNFIHAVSVYQRTIGRARRSNQEEDVELE